MVLNRVKLSRGNENGRPPGIVGLKEEMEHESKHSRRGNREARKERKIIKK